MRVNYCIRTEIIGCNLFYYRDFIFENVTNELCMLGEITKNVTTCVS